MDEDTIRELLESLSKGKISVDSTIDKLKNLPFEDIGIACIDHHRGLRRGLSEVIFGEGKEVDDIIAIMENMVEQDDNIMVTRISSDKAQKVMKRFPDSTWQTVRIVKGK